MPHPTQNRSVPGLLRRGVYRPRALSPEGFPFLIAITGDGRKIAERVIYPFESEPDVSESVWSTLDELDPT